MLMSMVQIRQSPPKRHETRMSSRPAGFLLTSIKLARQAGLSQTISMFDSKLPRFAL
jgi:hypothetical protein